MNRIMVSLAACSALSISPLYSQSNASQVSMASVMAGYSVTAGKLEMLDLVGRLVVEKVAPESGHVLVTLKAEKENFSMDIQLSKEVMTKAPLTPGQQLRVAQESTGNALYASEQLVAFIPNTLGRSLVYQHEYPAPGTRALPKEPVVVVR